MLVSHVLGEKLFIETKELGLCRKYRVLVMVLAPSL